MKKKIATIAFILQQAFPLVAQDLIFPTEAQQGNLLDLTVNVSEQITKIDSVRNVIITLTSTDETSKEGSIRYIQSASFYSDHTLFSKIALNSNVATGLYDLAVIGDGEVLFSIEDALNISEGDKMAIASINIPTPATKNSVLDVTISGSNTKFAKEPNLTLSFTADSALHQENPPFPLDIEVISDTKALAHIAVPYNCNAGTYNFVVSGDLSGDMLLENTLTISEKKNSPSATVSGKKTLKRSETAEFLISGEDINIALSEDNLLYFEYEDNANEGLTTFSSYGFYAQSNKYGKAAILIPENAKQGTYHAFFKNSICGIAETDTYITVTNETASPDVEISPCFAKSGERLSITITAQNRFFSQATDLAPIATATISDAKRSFECNMQSACFFSIDADISVSATATVGAYDLTLTFADQATESAIEEIHKEKFFVSRPLNSEDIRKYIHFYESYDSTFISFSQELTNNTNLQEPITYKMFLGTNRNLPKWCRYNSQNKTLAIAKNRFKAWENINVIIFAKDSEGNQDVCNFSTEIMYITEFYDNTYTARPEMIKQDNCVLYPNPATDYIQIQNKNSSIVPFEISNSSGLQILHGTTGEDGKIIVEQLPLGQYTIRYTTDKFSCIEKFVIE